MRACSSIEPAPCCCQHGCASPAALGLTHSTGCKLQGQAPSPAVTGVVHGRPRRTLFRRCSVRLFTVGGQPSAGGSPPQLHRVAAEEGHLIVAAPSLAAVQALVAAGIIALPLACSHTQHAPVLGVPRSEGTSAAMLSNRAGFGAQRMAARPWCRASVLEMARVLVGRLQASRMPGCRECCWCSQGHPVSVLVRPLADCIGSDHSAAEAAEAAMETANGSVATTATLLVPLLERCRGRQASAYQLSSLALGADRAARCDCRLSGSPGR